MTLGTFALLVAALCALAVLLLLNRRRHERLTKEWAEFGPEVLEQVSFNVEATRYELEDSIKAIRETLDIGYATTMMDGAAACIERNTPDRLDRLRAMMRFARMAAAIAPVSAGRFRLGRLTAVASLGRGADIVLVSPAERFWVRCWVLAYGFRLTLKVAMKSRRALIFRQMRDARSLKAFESALSDWVGCDEEHKETLRALMGGRK